MKTKFELLIEANNLFAKCKEFPSEIARRLQNALESENLAAMEAEIQELKSLC
jgi:hypothetical protein